MKNYKLQLKYVYTFYNFGEVLIEDVFAQSVDVESRDVRFTLHDQEDSSFILSAPKCDFLGSFVTVTFPNKDIIVIHEGETVELRYDEYFDSMGDDNHNVYQGTITLIGD